MNRLFYRIAHLEPQAACLERSPCLRATRSLVGHIGRPEIGREGLSIRG